MIYMEGSSDSSGWGLWWRFNQNLSDMRAPPTFPTEIRIVLSSLHSLEHQVEEKEKYFAARFSSTSIVNSSWRAASNGIIIRTRTWGLSGIGIIDRLDIWWQVSSFCEQVLFVWRWPAPSITDNDTTSPPPLTLLFSADTTLPPAPPRYMYTIKFRPLLAYIRKSRAPTKSNSHHIAFCYWQYGQTLTQVLFARTPGGYSVFARPPSWWSLDWYCCSSKMVSSNRKSAE